MELSVGTQRYLIRYNYPVDGSETRYKLRIARKSGYVDVIVPPSTLGSPRPNYTPTLRTAEPYPWNIHYLRLDTLSILDVSNPSKINWINSHCSFQMSDRERALRNQGDPNVSDILVNVKDTIHALITTFSGVQKGERSAVFGLSDPATVGNHTLIFFHSIRLDSASLTVAADIAIFPLNNALIPKLGKTLPALLKVTEVRSIITNGKEGTTWRQLIPAFVERCRTWSHKSSCEYLKPGAQIPLTTELDGACICTCGCGLGLPDAMRKIPGWKGLLSYATRAAISPLFAVSYVESVGSELRSIRKEAVGLAGEGYLECGGTGKPKLLVCGKCKQALYCSAECQTKHWKAGHRNYCKPA